MAKAATMSPSGSQSPTATRKPATPRKPASACKAATTSGEMTPTPSRKRKRAIKAEDSAPEESEDENVETKGFLPPGSRMSQLPDRKMVPTPTARTKRHPTATSSTSRCFKRQVYQSDRKAWSDMITRFLLFSLEFAFVGHACGGP